MSNYFPLFAPLSLPVSLLSYSFGFELEDLGGGSYAVNSVPGGLEGLNPLKLVQDMVSSAVEKL